MEPTLGIASKRRGSALLATLCFAGVLSLAVAGYLAVCYRSLVVSNREINSSHSIELAEIGMDEALWALNNGFDASWVFAAGNATKTLTDPEFPSHPPYPDPSSVPFTYDNGAKGSVLVKVESYLSANPVITVSGSMTLADGSIITRRLRSNAKPAQLFTNAIGAIDSVTFAAGGLVDSYDSSYIPHPTYDPANPTFTSVVSGTNVDLGSAAIYGFAATKGTMLQNQPGAKVTGTISGTGIDLSRVSQSARQPVFDVVSPSVTPSFDPITHLSQLTNTMTLTSGAYQFDSIDLPDGAELRIQSDVVLKVTNSVRTTGSGRIFIDDSTNASLELQIDENDGHGLILQGDGIVNPSGQAQKVSILVGRNYTGDAASSIDMAGNFYGSIYLPNDTLTVANNPAMYGAMVAKNIMFTGSAPQFHYDAALRGISFAGVSTPFALVQLRELKPTDI